MYFQFVEHSESFKHEYTLLKKCLVVLTQIWVKYGESQTLG